MDKQNALHFAQTIAKTICETNGNIEPCRETAEHVADFIETLKKRLEEMN